MSTLKLEGQSGKEYQFEIHKLGGNLPAVEAVYAVTKQYPKNGRHYHTVLYIGQTSDLQERFESHHKEDCFEANGANCVCVYRESNESSRLEIEKDLVANYNPKCND